MTINVELYGIPRSRAGVERTTAEGLCLGDVLIDLGLRFPHLAATCFAGQTLRAGFTANLQGDRFTTAPQTPLKDGDTVLLMSLDAGG